MVEYKKSKKEKKLNSIPEHLFPYINMVFSMIVRRSFLVGNFFALCTYTTMLSTQTPDEIGICVHKRGVHVHFRRACTNRATRAKNKRVLLRLSFVSDWNVPFWAFDSGAQIRTGACSCTGLHFRFAHLIFVPPPSTISSDVIKRYVHVNSRASLKLLIKRKIRVTNIIAPKQTASVRDRFVALINRYCVFARGNLRCDH